MRAFALAVGIAVVVLALPVRAAFALQAQPVPIPEDPSVSPQLNVSGVGIGTAGYARNNESPTGKARADFSDSALLVGAAQSMFDGGAVGSLGFGLLSTGDTAPNSLFLHQAFADYQAERFEAVLGRTDNPAAHAVDFPTLRGDDLLTLTTPLDPYSNGKSPEEHRYSDVASVTFNQGLRFFENAHAQHLLRSANSNDDRGIDAYGISLQTLASPGLEAYSLFPSLSLGYERLPLGGPTPNTLNLLYAGGTISLDANVVDHFELGVQDILGWGSDLRAFASATDSFRADANGVTASLRYRHSPFGRPSTQLALIAGFKKYTKVSGASSPGFALTLARRLGQGFDFVAQVAVQNRSAALALVQSQGIASEQRAEIGFAFNFDASINEHLAPRRSLLNQRHGFLAPAEVR